MLCFGIITVADRARMRRRTSSTNGFLLGRYRAPMAGDEQPEHSPRELLGAEMPGEEHDASAGRDGLEQVLRAAHRHQLRTSASLDHQASPCSIRVIPSEAKCWRRRARRSAAVQSGKAQGQVRGCDASPPGTTQ